MKKIYILTLALITSSFVGCTSNTKTSVDVGENTPTQVHLSPTILPTETSIPSEFTVAVSYESLSPSKIRISDINLTVEASGRLTQSILNIDTNITVPASFLSTLPLGGETPIISEVKLSEMSTPLALELSGGGGGAGTENGIFMAGGTQTYTVRTPLIVGQKIRFVVMISFSEYVNVDLQIPLTIDLIVQPVSLTPEG